jgi:AraC family transcriptional regulator, transcriptional activator of pobA
MTISNIQDCGARVIMSAIPLHHFSTTEHNSEGFEVMLMENTPAVARLPQPHRHTFYEVFWISEGSGTHCIDFTNYPIQPGTLYFITPGQVHYWNIEQAVRGYVALFTQHFVQLNRSEPYVLRNFDFFHRPDRPPFLYLPPEKATPIANIFRALLEEYSSIAFGRATVLQALLEILLVQTQRYYAAHKPVEISAGQQLTDAFLRLVELHFANLQSVSDYAERLGVTPGHLSDTVRNVTGLPAGSFIRQRIGLEAKRLLAHSDHTIAEICQVLSFKDSSYFTRFFRRETGVTPLNFRKKYHNFLV